MRFRTAVLTHGAPPPCTPETPVRMTPRAVRRSTTAFPVPAVVLVYGEVCSHGFVAEYDDPGYVGDNPFVPRGITWAGVRWAFTTHHMGNWNPLTWLSHMLDVQLFGLAAGAHHLVNVAFHL